MQIISNGQTVRSKTVQGLKDFNSQSLATQAKKGEQLVSMKPSIKKPFDLMDDDIVEISRENDTLRNEIDYCDEKCLEESKRKHSKHIDDEKRANLTMFIMGKQMKKQY